jgi:hypothetical protein
MARDLSRSRAILISNAVFTDKEIEALPAAVGCVPAMKALLTSELCGWPAGRVESLPDVTAPHLLARSLVEMVKGVQDVLLVYYVGHGLRTATGQLALALRETSYDPEALPYTAMLYESLASILRGSPARTKLVILDCCRAELGNKANFQFKFAGIHSQPADGFYFIGASNAWQSAKSPPDGGLPYFTEALIQVVQVGIPGKPPQLTIEHIFVELRARMLRAGHPEPVQSGIRNAYHWPFARNAAPPETHSELESKLQSEVDSLASKVKALSYSFGTGIEEARQVSRLIAEGWYDQAVPIIQRVAGEWERAAPAEAASWIVKRYILPALRSEASDQLEYHMARVAAAFAELAERVGATAASRIHSLERDVHVAVWSLSPSPATRNRQRAMMEDMARQLGDSLPKIIASRLEEDAQPILLRAERIIDEASLGFRLGLEGKLLAVTEQFFPGAQLVLAGAEVGPLRERVAHDATQLIVQAMESARIPLEDVLLEIVFDWSDPEVKVWHRLVGFVALLIVNFQKDMLSLEGMIGRLSPDRKINAVRERLFRAAMRELHEDRFSREVAEAAKGQTQESLLRLQVRVRSWLYGVVNYLDSEQFTDAFLAGMADMTGIVSSTASQLHDIASALDTLRAASP